MIAVNSRHSARLSILFILMTTMLSQANAMDLQFDGVDSEERKELITVDKNSPKRTLQSIKNVADNYGDEHAIQELKKSLDETRTWICDITDKQDNSILYHACLEGYLACVAIILNVAIIRKEIMGLLTMLNQSGDMALLCAKRLGYENIATTIIRSGNDCGLELEEYAKTISRSRNLGVCQIRARGNSPVS